MNNRHLIEKFFNQSLTPKEQMDFNDLVQNSEAFKKEFLFQKDLKKVIATQEKRKLKTKLQGFEKKINNNLPFHRYKWLVAASIVILLSIGIGCFNHYYPSDKKIYTDNFTPYRNIVEPIVRGEKKQTIQYIAFLAYENKEYNKAIFLFNDVENPNTTQILFYKAMCYLSANNPKQAIEILEPISNNQSKSGDHADFNEISNWYLALAYLKNGEKEKSIKQFTQITNQPDNYFHKKEAIQILSFLK